MSHVVVINLSERTDRRRDMERELSRIGWQATFFHAIRPDDAADFSSVGARGCFLSHLAVLKQNVGVANLVVLEDDMNFVADFNLCWPRAMESIKDREWSILYPGHRLADLPPGLTKLPSDRVVQATHFMMFNGRAIPSLIAGLEIILSRPKGHPLGGPMHVDGAYSTIRAQNPELLTYAYSPSLGYQRPSRTDVGDLRWFDQITLLRPGIRLLRMIKGRISSITSGHCVVQRAREVPQSHTTWGLDSVHFAL